MSRMDLSAATVALRRLEKICCGVQREDLPPAAQWLRDNARLLYHQTQQAQESAREYHKAAYRQLKMFCKQFLQENDRCVQEKNLYPAVQHAQEERFFTVRELRGMESMLRIALTEELLAVLPLIEREVRAFEQGGRWALQLMRGEDAALAEEPVALCRAMERLLSGGDTLAARRLDGLMREKEWQYQAVARLSEEMCRHSAEQIANVIRSLKNLEKIDFGRLTERLSDACRVLREESIFRRTDAAGRALYLTAAEEIARKTGESESRVCEEALRLSKENSTPGGCAYYLMENPDALTRALGHKPGIKGALRGHVLEMYRILTLAGALAFLAAGACYLPWWGAVPFAFVGAQLAQRAGQRVFLRIFPPQRLPRLQGRELCRAGRTLVAVPTVLSDAKQTLRMMRQLSVLYLANQSAPLDFMLLGDYTDADGAQTPQDEEILTALRMGVEALREAYGPRFFALQRARTYDAGEGKYIGSERKRGAILTLCRLLTGEKTAESMAYASVPAESLRGRYRYVITLDSDTFMPAGAAEKMILTMMHPLQRGRCAVLQPRMATLPMHVHTRAQKVLFGMSGTGGYDGAAGDFYQNVFRRGSFMGKGILEPEAFLKSVEQLPPGHILSHDLIEGELAGAQLMSDIACFDGHPRTVEGMLRREQRWTRGDWQLLPVMQSKKLDALSKFKMRDNLRRSLVLPMRVLSLIAAAYAGAWIPFILCLLPLKQFGEWLLLPAMAQARLDGIVRALWRMGISRRHLLEWTTAAQGDREEAHFLREYALPMLPGALLAFASAHGLFWPGFLLGAAWLCYPLIARMMNMPQRPKEELSGEDRTFLLEVAGDTLRFFREHVNAQTHDLPPDNVQLSPPKGAAMRTSPTNIGMYLLSLCAARKLSLITGDEMLRRMEKTALTLEKMEKWHGNLYNWYDLDSLSPLPPRFVSSVDAGNLCICLMAAAQCARRYMHEGDRALRGVPARLDRLCREMQLQRLYDKKEELFFIGYDADKGEMTEGYYDLMASEALLLSYTAIALGKVGEKHWWRLDRTFTRVPGGKTLLSWSGTMFEYLLPALLLPSFAGSLLDKSQKGCVKTQMKYAREMPFGISESGYAQFDENLNYAYRAFGVPEMALSSDSTACVRAPYAAALALVKEPKAAVQALRGWKARGVYGAHGFFEAEDFGSGEVPRIVCSHMAHHQGMILCAICNALCGEDLAALCFSLPRMRAHLPLLCELPPRRVRRLPGPLRAHRDEKEAAPFHLRAQSCLPPDVHVLSGGGTTHLQSACGQGYIAQGEVLLTRFEPAAHALCGPQVYLRDVRADASVRLTGGEYLFSDGQWKAGSELGAIRCSVSGCVDPLTGAVVYAVRARNLSEHAVRTEMTVYLEPALETMKKDMAHRAFSDLFLSVEQSGVREVTVRRRLREGGERRMRLRVLSAGSGQMRVTNDRAVFIGRTGSTEQPRGLKMPDAAFRLRPVSEPCAALRLPWVIPAGRAERVLFALGAGELPENEQQAERAAALCASRSQVMQRLVQADTRMTALLCRMAGYFLWENLPGRAYAPAGVRELWAQGVSGDRPFALIEFTEKSGEGTLRQAFRLLALLFEHGVTGECAVLLPGEEGYDQPLRTLCEGRLMQPFHRALRGRVKLISGAGEDFIRAARALCAVRIDCAEDIRKQLSGVQRPLPMLYEEGEGQLPPIPRLEIFNGFGGFTQEGGYTVLPAAHGGTPAPWSFILCNAQFGTLLCAQGILYSHAGNARLRRITAVCQNGVEILPAEEYFISENGRMASFTKAGAPGESYRVTYEAGTAVYEHAARHFLLTLTCFADEKENAGLRLISVKNTTKEAREATVYLAVRFAMGESGRGTACKAQDGYVTASGGDMPGCAAVSLAGTAAKITCGSMYALPRGGRVPEGTGEGSVALMQWEVQLNPGETKEWTAVIFHATEERDIPRLRALGAQGKTLLRRVRGAWAQRLGRMQFYLPDGDLSRYLNFFLPYQIRASRLEMRAGFYQSGGAFGFRDQLQDMLALVYTEPERVREHLLRCAARQYLEGDVQHWWHPYGAGVRTRISDDLLFLPYVTARYVYVTGDREILCCHAPYLRSEELRDGEHDRYEMAETTEETETLLGHCLRALNRMRLGPQGIPLMQGGDWNDGMDRVGGESVWLGFFYLIVLRDFAPLCAEKTCRELMQRAQALEENMRRTFHGQWFVRAWYEDGRSIGAHDSEVPRIDLISQCFAAFAGMPRNQVLSALDCAWERLHDEKTGVTYLMDPPFSPEEEAGYIGAYLPGVRENGGQYTHAVPWFMRALLQYGRHGRAWQLLEETLPYNHAFDVPSARHYRTEPYALAADIYRWGRGGWTWYTGSAAWLYDVILRDFLGFDKRGSEVTLRPRAPEDWEECTVLYHYGTSRYQLTASREMQYVTLDGERVKGDYISLCDDGRAHEARFPMGEA